jgi:uroporphyrinogen-III synthase
VDTLPPAVLEAFERDAVDWVTFTSSSIATNLLALLGAQGRTNLSRCRRASIGPVTSAAMRGLGLEPTVEAATASIPALVEAMAASPHRTN